MNFQSSQRKELEFLQKGPWKQFNHCIKALGWPKTGEGHGQAAPARSRRLLSPAVRAQVGKRERSLNRTCRYRGLRLEWPGGGLPARRCGRRQVSSSARVLRWTNGGGEGLASLSGAR